MSKKNEYYFHLCPIELSPRSIVKASNWGRIVRSYPNVQGVNFWILFREQTFEMIRMTEFLDRPSRYKCSFLFETRDQAELFKQQNNRIFDILHKVKPVDSSKPMHKCCMQHVNLAQNVLVLPQVEAQARLYWQGTNILSPEIITESDIEIIGVV